jgi:hypothetical protein
MNIAGYNINMPDVNWAGTIQTTAMWGIIGIGIIALGIWWYYSSKDKKALKYPVTLRVRRSNGTKVRYDLRGGVFAGKNGIKDFMVKFPKQMKKFNLGYMPDFSLADSNDRLSFLQEGDATSWQQIKEELITEKTIIDENGKELGIYKLLLEPIPTDTKTTTYNNLQNTRELMDAKKLTAWGISIVAFIVMVVAHLISLYIQTKVKCGTP